MADVNTAALAFKTLSDRLRFEAEEDLRRELSNAINRAARPAVAAIRRDMPEHMPNRYADVLRSDVPITIRQQSARRNFGVRVTASERGARTVERRRLLRLDRGVLEHPLFGNRKRWYSQEVRPLFFEEPIMAQHQQIRDAVIRAMGDVAAKLTRKA